MLRRGARRFVFLSRSGADAKVATLLVQDLREAGAEVSVIRGDVSVREDVERAIKSVPADRPIRGVINAAMVLQVSYFNFSLLSYISCQGSLLPQMVHRTEFSKA
jgi:NAD(P)-dependent dehydrogenase (short-subunit alcohol dehydrogenase family)